MNADKLQEGERCASTSNRNLRAVRAAADARISCPPEMAAAAAIAGHFVDVRKV